MNPTLDRQQHTWLRHYRFVCFTILWMVYLAVLFGVCELHDGYLLSRNATRVLAPAVELSLAALFCAGCTRLGRRYASAWWLIPAALCAAAVGLVYLIQINAMLVSNDFVTVLALENTDSTAFAPSPALAGGIVAYVLWLAYFCAGLVHARHAHATGAERWPRYAWLAAVVGVALLTGWLLALQRRNQWLEPGFRQAPLVSLTATLYASQFQTGASSNFDGPRTHGCFVDPERPTISPYPFEKPFAYHAALPFQTLRRGQPNVIVIFTEGTSARLLGAYGGHYPGLTPNIDRLAARSMQVDNYFNHTAATYRGLIGQLTSGYVYYGGAGAKGWTNNDRRLGAIQRRTLPMILAPYGYQSYFFSPQPTADTFTEMLDTLGFNHVFTSESIGTRLLAGHYRMRAGTHSLDDASLFRGLVAFLQRRHDAGDTKPFFIGLYNIGTHAFIHIDADDVRYGDSHNPALNRLHNYDHAVGLLLNYFLASPYADNTILVFTTDHATYPEADYRAVAGKDLKPFFVDRVPLLIDDPFHRLPSHWNADGRNSLDLAPTLLQLLGIRRTQNSFLGQSLFEPRSFALGITALGRRFYLTDPRGVFDAAQIPPALRPTFACEVHVVKQYYQAEATNHLTSARPPTR